MTYSQQSGQEHRAGLADDRYAGRASDVPVVGDPGRDAWGDPSTAVDPVTGRVLPADPAAGLDRPRASLSAVLGLSAGLVGLCAALTGLLAPEGLVVAGLGALLCVVGLIRAGRPGIAGRGVAAVGTFVAICAAALAVVAISGRYSWLDSGTDQVADAHQWLLDHWSWLDRWS